MAANSVQAAEPVRWARNSFIATLPVLAVLLGGSTAKWAEGIILVLLGGCLLLQPPRLSLGWITNAVFAALALCALLSFAPQTWFFVPAWRRMLMNDFGVALPGSLTPQPWLTLGCFISLLAALSWLYLVATQDLELRAARSELRVFAAGVIGIAALSIAVYLPHHSLPSWSNERGFGPFPNSKQTADLFALSSVVILAAAQDDFRKGRKRWLVWTLGLVIIITALVLNNSRAGILILLFGSAVWITATALRTASPVRITMTLTVSLLLLLVCALLIRGGETLSRFHLQSIAGHSSPLEFRSPIFHDTWQLIQTSPWCGIGLGNFEAVFAVFRNASRGDTRLYHPGSDWLWVWAELGPVAIALILLGAFLLIRRVRPLTVGSNQRFRIAALLGAVLFALHGLIDVSGHRVGTAYCALFLLGLSLHRPLALRPARALPWLFRVVGILLIVAGAAWTVASGTMALLPGSTGVANAKELAGLDSRGRNFAGAINLSTRALDWAPLDWELYSLRATAEVAARAPLQSAVDDFRRARFLEPNAISVPLEEGIVWSGVKPELTLIAWREALRRAGEQRPGIFRRIFFQGAVANPNERGLVEQLAFSYPELVLPYMRELPPPDFRGALRRYLESDPELGLLSDAAKRDLLVLWRERGDAASLAEFLQHHPH